MLLNTCIISNQFFFFFFFLISYICLFIYIYFLRQAKKEAKNLTLVRQTLEMTELIHGMHTRLDFVNNMGGSLLATPLPMGV